MTYQDDIRAIRDSQSTPSASPSRPVSVDLSALRAAMAAEKDAMEAILAKCRSWQISLFYDSRLPDQ